MLQYQLFSCILKGTFISIQKKKKKGTFIHLLLLLMGAGNFGVQLQVTSMDLALLQQLWRRLLCVILEGIKQVDSQILKEFLLCLFLEHIRSNFVLILLSGCVFYGEKSKIKYLKKDLDTTEREFQTQASDGSGHSCVHICVLNLCSQQCSFFNTVFNICTRVQFVEFLWLLRLFYVPSSSHAFFSS